MESCGKCLPHELTVHDSLWIVSGLLCLVCVLSIWWCLPKLISWVNHRPVWPQWGSVIGAKSLMMKRRYLCRDLGETILCRRKQQFQNSETEGYFECLRERLCTPTSRAECFITCQLWEDSSSLPKSGPGSPPSLGKEKEPCFDKLPVLWTHFIICNWKVSGLVPELTSYSKKVWLFYPIRKKRCKVSLVYLKSTEWAPIVCFLQGQCSLYSQCTNSNDLGTHHPHARWRLPPASTSHSPARGFLPWWEHIHPARKARVAVGAPGAALGHDEWEWEGQYPGFLLHQVGQLWGVLHAFS